MPIQTQIVHIYIIVVWAVLLTVDEFHDHELACEALVEADGPFGVARHWLDPEHGETVELFKLQNLSQLFGRAQVDLIREILGAIRTLVLVLDWQTKSFEFIYTIYTFEELDYGALSDVDLAISRKKHEGFYEAGVPWAHVSDLQFSQKLKRFFLFWVCKMFFIWQTNFVGLTLDLIVLGLEKIMVYLNGTSEIKL